MATAYKYKWTIGAIVGIIRSESNSHYFDRDTLKFFNQRTKDFKVKASPTGRIFVYAPSYWEGRSMGYSAAEFIYVEGFKDKTTMTGLPSDTKDSLKAILTYIENN